MARGQQERLQRELRGQARLRQGRPPQVLLLVLVPLFWRPLCPSLQQLSRPCSYSPGVASTASWIFCRSMTRVNATKCLARAYDLKRDTATAPAGFGVRGVWRGLLHLAFFDHETEAIALAYPHLPRLDHRAVNALRLFQFLVGDRDLPQVSPCLLQGCGVTQRSDSNRATTTSGSSNRAGYRCVVDRSGSPIP